MTRTFPALLAAALLWGSASLADTLDFTGLPSGNLGGSVSVGGVTLEGIGTSTLSNQSDRYFESAGGSICAQRGSGANCRGDMNIKFNGKVKKLSFFSAGYQPGDTATIVVYRGKNVVGTTGFSWNGKVNLATYGRVTRIKIEYEGVEDGMALGKFNFTRVATKHNNGGAGWSQGAPLAAATAPADVVVAMASAKGDGKGGGGKGKGDGKSGGKGNGGSGHKGK